MVIEQRMSIQETRAVLMPYLESHHSDVSAMARDVVFRNMATGEEARGPEAVLAMLNFFYKVAFDADAETRNVVIGEGIGVVEGLFVGRHVGEFAGIRATGKEVRVPICVIYELRDGEIVEGRVYFETPALLAQLGAPTGQP
jgi:predicted ester cyclase